jgi:hypothetical protein
MQAGDSKRCNKARATNKVGRRWRLAIPTCFAKLFPLGGLNRSAAVPSFAPRIYGPYKIQKLFSLLGSEILKILIDLLALGLHSAALELFFGG